MIWWVFSSFLAERNEGLQNQLTSMVNSGEQVLVFALQATLEKGTSGLMTTFSLQDLLMDEARGEERKGQQSLLYH